MRKFCIALSTVVVLAGLPALAKTTAENAAALSEINANLSAAHDASYASYLTAIDDNAPQLVSLATLSDTVLEGDMTEAKLDAIGVALSAATQLAHLPFPSETETAAIERAIGYGAALKDYCLEADPIPSVCPQGLSDASYLESRAVTSSLLASSQTSEALTLGDTSAKFEELRLALPTIVDLLMDYDAEPIMNAAAVESACDVNRAIPLLAEKIEGDAEANLKRQSMRVYGRLFDLSGLPLCDVDGFVCRAAERCARSGTAPDCMSLKAERIMTACTPDSDGLVETLAALK